MSVIPPPLPPPEALAPGTLRCPRCGEVLAPDQDWCLRCGDPARTVIAPTPRWRRPIVALLALAALALGILAAAFVALTNDDPPPPQVFTKTITTQPGQPLPPGVTPAPTTGGTPTTAGGTPTTAGGTPTTAGGAPATTITSTTTTTTTQTLTTPTTTN